MSDKNLLSIYAKSFNWAGFFLPKETYNKCSALYDFCRIADNIADDDEKIERKKTKFIQLEKDFNHLVGNFSKDLKNGIISNVDPIPIAIIHSAMIIWEEELKNKYNKKNKNIISKTLFNYLEQVFYAFSCKADIKNNYYNWHNLQNMR